MATLSITIEDNLLKRLKEHVPSGKISKFINKIILEKISDKEINLINEYVQAETIYAKCNELKDWDSINGNDW